MVVSYRLEANTKEDSAKYAFFLDAMLTAQLVIALVGAEIP
jgi:hypothetical protein